MKEAEFQAYLSTIRKEDWQQLFALLEVIEKAKDFGKLHGMKAGDGGQLYAPYWESSEVVRRFFNIVYEMHIVFSFNWMDWEQGKGILRNNAQNYELLDSLALCKLITTIVRADRFNDGYLNLCFEEGIVEKILVSLKRNVENASLKAESEG